MEEQDLQENPLHRLLLDCFVSESSGGIEVIERSLWAHRWQFGTDCGTVAHNLLPNESGTSRSEGDRVALYYESLVAKKLMLVHQKKPQPSCSAGSPKRRSAGRRGNHGSPIAHMAEEHGPVGKVLSRSEIIKAVHDVDLFDHVTTAVDDAVLTMTMSHSVSARTNASVPLGAFSYIVSRSMLRTGLLQLPREELSHMGNSAASDIDINALLVQLLPLARTAAIQWYCSVDVDGLGLVPWSAITSALVEHCSSQHLKRCLQDALQDVARSYAPTLPDVPSDDESSPAKEDRPLKEEEQRLPERRIGTYDRYQSLPFPTTKALRPFSNAVVVVHRSPYVLLEGRGELHAVVSRDDLCTIRHFLPRHRIEGTKLAGTTVVYATMVDECGGVMCVAEVDMCVHVYDASCKRRKYPPLIARVRTGSAIVACCYIPRSTALIIGDRTGTVKAINIRQVVSEAMAHLAESPPLDDGSAPANHPLEFQLDDGGCGHVVFYSETLHRDTVTGLATVAPSLLLSSSLDGTVAVVHATTWTFIRNFTAHENGIGVRSIAGDERLTTFATHGYDGKTILWYSAHGVNCSTLIEPLIPHQHRVDWMFVDAVVQQLITVDVSGLVKVWDMLQQSIITTFFAVTAMPPYLLGQEVAGTGGIDGGGLLMKDIPFDTAPAQAVAFDAHKHRLFVRGHHNDVMCTLMEGRKMLSAHPMAVRAIYASPSCVATMCAKTLRSWAFPLLELRCEVQSLSKLSQGDTPAALPHQVPEHHGLGEHRATRSDILHEAIDPEGVTLGGNVAFRSGAQPPVDLGDVYRFESCASCVDANATLVFVVLGSGEVRCHHLATGKCLKVFQAVALQNIMKGGLRGSSTCGQSMDAVSCAYIDHEHVLVVCYSDGAVRYFSNVGGQRKAFGVQVVPDEDAKQTVEIGASQRVSVASMASLGSAPGRAEEFDLEQSLSLSRTISSKTLRTASVGIGVSTCSSSLRLAANAFTDGRLEVIDLAMTQPLVKVVHATRCAHEVLCMLFLGDIACLVVGDAESTLSCFVVRGSPLLSIAHEIVVDTQTSERKRRVSRAFSTSPTAVRTPTVPSASVPSNRRKTVLSAAAAMAGAGANSLSPIATKGAQLHCIAVAKLVAKPSSLAFANHDELIVVGLVDGRIQILQALGLVCCASLAPTQLSTSPSDHYGASQHANVIRESATRVLMKSLSGDSPSVEDACAQFLMSTSTTPNSLRVDGGTAQGGGQLIALHDAMTTVMMLQLIHRILPSLPAGTSLDHLADGILFSKLLRSRGRVASRGASAATLRVHDELVPLLDSVWVHDGVLMRRSGPSCFAPLHQRLRAALAIGDAARRRSTLDGLDVSMMLNLQTDQPVYDSAPITAVERLSNGLLLVGNLNGEVGLSSICDGGLLAVLNAGSSLAASLLERVAEWHRAYMYAHHKAYVAMSGPSGGDSVDAEHARERERNASIPADLFQVGESFEAWAEVPVPVDRVKGFLLQRCQQLLRTLSSCEAPCAEEPRATHATRCMEEHLHQRLLPHLSFDDVSATSTPQESFLDAFKVGAVQLETPPTRVKAAASKSTPMTPSLLVVPGGIATPFTPDHSTARPPRGSCRSPRAASFLVVDDDGPHPLLTVFTRPPHTSDGDEPAALHSPQESLNSSTSMFQHRPKRDRVVPRVVLAPPPPKLRPTSASMADMRPSHQHIAQTSPRRAQHAHHARLPLDVRIRYQLGDSLDATPDPATVDKTRDMARVVTAEATSLSTRLVAMAASHHSIGRSGPQDIGFGLVLPHTAKQQ